MSYYYKGSSGPLIAEIPLSNENMVVQVATNTYPLQTEYDHWDDSKRASMYLNMEQFTTLGIRNNRGSGGRIWIQKTELFLVWGGNFLTSNLLWEHDWGNEKILNGYAKAAVMVGQDHSDAENDMWWAGDCEFYVRVTWKDKNDNKTISWFKPIIFVGSAEQTTPTLHVHRPTLTSINIGATKRDFYINEEFSVDYGAIKAIYKYVVDGATFEEKVFSNFTSNPSVGTKLKNPDTSKPIEQGFKQNVTISYGGKSQTYDITVKGVKSFTKPELPQYIKLGAYTGDLENTVFTYDDDTTTSAPTNVSALVTPGFVGYFDVSYNSYASKIKQYGRWGSAENTRFEDE